MEQVLFNPATAKTWFSIFISDVFCEVEPGHIDQGQVRLIGARNLDSKDILTEAIIGNGSNELGC